MNKDIKPNKLYTTEETSELLNVDTETVRRYIRNAIKYREGKKLYASKIGKRYYISGQAIQDIIGIGNLDIPAVMLEKELISLDLGKEANIKNVEDSKFYGTATVIKRIAQDSRSRTELIKLLADYIRAIRK